MTKRSHQFGLTLIELLVVLASIALLLSIAAPRYVEHVDRAREAALRSNLAAMREAIDRFHADRGAFPSRLLDLVDARYLRTVPVDPFTERTDTWTLVAPPAGATRDSSASQIGDVHSGASGQGRDGRPYASW